MLHDVKAVLSELSVLAVINVKRAVTDIGSERHVSLNCQPEAGACSA